MMPICPQGEPVCAYTSQFSHTLTASIQHAGSISLECDNGIANVVLRRTAHMGEYELLVLCKGAHRVIRVRVR